jgi:hypothetical protein
MFGPVPPAKRRLSVQPSTPFEQTAARATGPAAMERSPERRPLDIVQAGLCRHRDRRDQRILPHAISQELTLSSSGALIAATAPSPRPVTVRVTQPGLATVIQYDLRMP